MLGGESGQRRHPASHQGGGHQLAPTQGTEFFVPGPQRSGPVEHPHSLTLPQLQQMGGIEVGLIHRRVLAHPNPREGG